MTISLPFLKIDRDSAASISNGIEEPIAVPDDIPNILANCRFLPISGDLCDHMDLIIPSLMPALFDLISNRPLTTEGIEYDLVKPSVVLLTNSSVIFERQNDIIVELRLKR